MEHKTRAIGAALLLAVSIISLSASGTAFAQAQCPKVLMFDGVNVAKRFDVQDAKYWASVGIDGFFVGRVMDDWAQAATKDRKDSAFGSDENNEVYRRLRSFQRIYASQGVAFNFLKIATAYQGEPHFGWTPAEIDAVARRFRDAAHLARYAGLMGIALDLEPYQAGLWTDDPGIPNKSQSVYTLGLEVGRAIVAAFPAATLIVIPEVLQYASSQNYPNYKLSAQFWRGLIQNHFARMVIATERSYHTKFLEKVVADAVRVHKLSLEKAGVPLKNVSFAFGLWPLGTSYTNKAAHETPEQFYERLCIAFAAEQPYVWIYGHGSGWQANGPYGSGPVAPQFADFVRALKRVKAECGSHTLPIARLPMPQNLWSLAK